MNLDSFILLFSLITLKLAPLFIWRSKLNTLSITNIGFCFTAYLIPIIALPIANLESEKIYSLYIFILFWGSISYFLFIYIGYKLTESKNSLNFSAKEKEKENRQIRYSEKVALICITGMIATYYVIGFIPFFAMDPFSAKFLRGAYQLGTLQNIMYRFFTEAASICVILMLAAFFDTRKIKYLLISVLLITIFILNLTRAPMGFAALLILGFYLAKKNKILLFLIISVLSYSAGSVIYMLFGINASFYDHTNYLTSIASGAPDITDQLNFLSRFEYNPIYTYGLTFIGGLIPGRFDWNPAVWSLLVGTSGYIEDIASGGLRIPGPIMAYTAFGKIGIFIVMSISGLINGFFLKKLKNNLSINSTYFSLALYTVFYLKIGLFLSSFYWMSYLDLISILILIPIFYKITFTR